MSQLKCVLLKDHNAVTPLRLEPATPWSQVKLSTTEPLRSLKKNENVESETKPKSSSNNSINCLNCSNIFLNNALHGKFLIIIRP